MVKEKYWVTVEDPNTLHEGIVVSINLNRGFGFIQDLEKPGPHAFFHYAECFGGFSGLRAGHRVQYIEAEAQGGRRAIGVRRAPDGPQPSNRASDQNIENRITRG